MSKALSTRSSVADASNPDMLRERARMIIAGVGIVAVSLLTACQSPVAILPNAGALGRVESIASSSIENAARAPAAVYYAPQVDLELRRSVKGDELFLYPSAGESPPASQATGSVPNLRGRAYLVIE